MTADCILQALAINTSGHALQATVMDWTKGPVVVPFVKLAR